MNVLIHLLKSGWLFDVASGGQNVERNHDEDEQTGLEQNSYICWQFVVHKRTNQDQQNPTVEKYIV